MGQTAESKFEQADRLHKMAVNVKKHDPESAVRMESLARRKRRAGITQMSRRPRRNRASSLVI